MSSIRSRTSVDSYVQGVGQDGPCEIVLVDGWQRMRCVQAAANLVQTGGVLNFANANQPDYLEAPELLSQDRRLASPGLSPARVWATKTAIYLRQIENGSQTRARA